MRTVTIYNLQEQVRRYKRQIKDLNKKYKKKETREKHKRVLEGKIRETEQHIYDVAVAQNKLYIGTNYAKKLQPTKKDALIRIRKDFGQFLRRDKNKAPKIIPADDPSVSKQDKLRKLQRTLVLKSKLKPDTARYIAMYVSDNTNRLDNLTLNDIDEEFAGVWANRLRQRNWEGLVTRNGALFSKVHRQPYMRGKMQQIDDMMNSDNNFMDTYHKVWNYIEKTYIPLVYEKLGVDKGVDELEGSNKSTFFMDVADEFIRKYREIQRQGR